IRDKLVTGVQTCALPIYLTPFRDLIAQSSHAAAPIPIPNTLFDTWIDATDTILCNAIPVRWSNTPQRGDTPTAEQRTPSVGTWRSEERRVGKSVSVGGRR